MKNKSFTLIELLIVIVIVGIIATIVINQYRVLVLRSEAGKGKRYARAVSDAVWFYYLEKGDFPETPPFGSPPPGIDVEFSYTTGSGGRQFIGDWYITYSKKTNFGSEFPESSVYGVVQFVNDKVWFDKTAPDGSICAVAAMFTQYPTTFSGKPGQSMGGDWYRYYAMSIKEKGVVSANPVWNW